MPVLGVSDQLSDEDRAHGFGLESIKAAEIEDDPFSARLETSLETAGEAVRGCPTEVAEELDSDDVLPIRDAYLKAGCKLRLKPGATQSVGTQALCGQPPKSSPQTDHPRSAFGARLLRHRQTSVAEPIPETNPPHEHDRARHTIAVQFLRDSRRTELIDSSLLQNRRSPRGGEKERPPAGLSVVLIRHALTTCRTSFQASIGSPTIGGGGSLFDDEVGERRRCPRNRVL